MLPKLLKSSNDPRLKELAGRKEIRWLGGLLAKLSRRSEHGNRLLKAHHVLAIHLVGFFNPMIRSLRTLELASQSQTVRELVDMPRVCRSTHNDFPAVADPELLTPLIEALQDTLGAHPSAKEKESGARQPRRQRELTPHAKPPSPEETG